MLKGRSADMAKDVVDDAPPRRRVTNDDDAGTTVLTALLVLLRENALAVLLAEPRRRATRIVLGIEIRMIFYPTVLDCDDACKEKISALFHQVSQRCEMKSDLTSGYDCHLVQHVRTLPLNFEKEVSLKFEVKNLISALVQYIN